MIISRVKITDWRNIRTCELFPKPGLNILHGQNEKGKSSVVEAIHKALYWDHTQRKQKGDNLDRIVPGDNLTARPTVEVDLEFGELKVRIKKVVADSKTHRQCVLTLKRPDEPEQVLRDEAAQLELARLLNEQKSSPGLHVSRQGECHDYLADALPGAACDALTVGQNGAIHASARLAAIRQTIDQERPAKLGVKLKQPLSGVAKAGSDAYRWRDERQAKSAQLVEVGTQLARVDNLRHEILKREREVAALEPQVQPAKTNLASKRDMERRQKAAETHRLQSKSAADALDVELRDVEKRSEEIASLRKQLADSSETQTDQQRQLVELEQKAVDARRRHSAEKACVDKAESGVDSLRKRIDAIVAKQNLLRQQAAGEIARQNVVRLENLHDQSRLAEKEAAELGKWPTGAQIGAWRKSFAELSELKRDASTRLQVTLDLLRPATIDWSADGGPSTSTSAAPGRPETIGGVRSLQLRIEDVGSIQINCGATELGDLLGDIAANTGELEAAISGFGIMAHELPAGFDRLEEYRIAGEEAARQAKEAKGRVEDAEVELGKLAELRTRLATIQQQLTTAEVKFSAVQSLVPEGLDAAGLDMELDSLKEQLEAGSKQLEQAKLELESAVSGVTAAQTAFTVCDVAASQAKAQSASLNRRLTELAADGLGDEERADKIRGLRIQLAAALEEAAAAGRAVGALGPAIDENEIKALEANLEELVRQMSEKQRALAEDRREVSTVCGNDPQGTADALNEEITNLDARLAGEDRKLSALVLLQAVLAAERQNLARLIAAPLNERISPWLKQIRGLETRVEFDPETSRITRIITDTGSGPLELPFEDHSEGMKGQVSLLVRLTLARVIAQQTGGGHLVILDDPLTETSPDRRPEMFRVLQQAAQDLQILFVTCHDDVLGTIPGQPHRLEL